IYISTAGGGAWKTKNSGLTWTPLFDSQLSAPLFSGTIAVAPSDPRVIYLGTGEPNFSGDSFYGTGVYKSTDSGKTWTLLTDPSATTPNPIDGRSVSRLVVDPNNKNRVFAAVSSGLNSVGVGSGPASGAGVWRFDGKWFNMTA